MSGALAALVGSAYGGHTISLSNVSASSIGSGVQTASYELTNAGDVRETEGGATNDVGDWIAPKDSFANYEVRATLNTGSVDSGTTGSWLNLGTTRTWSVTDATAGAGGTKDADLTIEIRHKDQPGSILKSVNVLLHAERT